MKNLFKSLMTVVPAMLCCCVIASSPSAKAAQPHRLILPEELPLPDGIESFEDMTVIIVDGTVCVTDKEGAVLYDTTVSADSLTKADREMLERGISASDYLKLIRLIENYTS